MVKFYRVLFFALLISINYHKSFAQNTQVTPAPPQSNICVGSGYVTLGPIYIAETNFANFLTGNDLTYEISVPANFEFNTGAIPSITTNNPATGVSIDAGQTIVTSTTITFRYDVPGGSTGTGPLDSIIITGIQVRAITQADNGALARSGGTGLMAGNAPADGHSHCNLTSIQDPLITGQPTAQDVCVNADPTFTVTATGTGLTYQWRRYNVGSASWGNPPGGSYSGSTTPTLTVNNAGTVQDGFLFTCLVTGTCGTVSTDTVMLTVNNAVNVTVNPPNRSICANANTTFTVSASGSSLSYQWQESIGGGPYTNITNGGVYSGATTNTLTLTSVPMSMSGRTYRCVVSNPCSSDNSNAGTLTVSAGPTINTQPGDASICAGANTNFIIGATGATSYQWQVDEGVGFNNVSGGVYSGATSATLTLTGVTAPMNGYLYRCIVTNSCGSVNSNAASLSVISSGSSTFFGLATEYCRNAAVDTLEGFPVGGTFSGTGVGTTNLSTGKAAFDPSVGGLGGRTITYTYGCTVTNKNTTIKDTTNIAYTNPSNATPVYFTTDAPVELEVELVPPTGALPGTFSGTGVSGTRFYPSIAGAGGPFPVWFTYTNLQGCQSRVVTNISVGSPGLGIPPLLNASPFCQGGNSVIINDTTVDGGKPNFNANYRFGGYTGPGISFVGGPGGNDYMFSPTSPGSYVITYWVESFIGILGIGFWFPFPYASQTVTVNSPTAIEFSLPSAICNNAASFDLTPAPPLVTGGSGTGFSVVTSGAPAGLLSGPGNSTFNPSVVTGSSPKTLTIRYTYREISNNCISTKDKQITVSPKPPLPTLIAPSAQYAAQNSTYCYGSFRKDLAGVDYDSIDYNWYDNASLSPANKISDDYLFQTNFSGDDDPTTYLYYLTQTINGCTSDPLIASVTITDGAVVDAGVTQTICEGNTVTLSGFSELDEAGDPLDATWISLTGGSFSDPNSLTATYTPSATDITNQYVDLILQTDDPDGGGPCPQRSDVVRIIINKAASVFAGNDSYYCSNSIINLEGTASTSVHTWTGGSGVIANPGSLFTAYTLSGAEKNGTTIVFTLSSADPDGAGPCPIVSDNVSITISEEGKVDAGSDQAMCRSLGATVFNLNGLSERRFTGNPLAASWSGGMGTFSDNNSLTSTYTPAPSEIPADGSDAKEVTLYLTTFDPDGPGATGPCSALVDSVVLTVNPLPRIDSVKVVDTMFCTSDNPFPITIVMESKYPKLLETFTDLPVPNQGLSGSNTFAPGIANIGTHTIRYTYTDINGCSSFRDTLIHVYGVPKPKIIVTDYCADRATNFDGTSSDISFDPESVITSYAWDFGDNIDSDTSSLPVTSYIYTPTLEASATKSYNIKLRVGTDKGCLGLDDSTITIGNIPATNFKWSGICPSDITAFTDISGFPSNEVFQYTWNFGDATPPITGPGLVAGNPNLTVKNPSHQMANGSGPYNVIYTISSIRGCDSTITKRVDILDDYQPTPSDPYATNFVNSNAFWAVDGTNASWQWGASNKPIINSGTRKIWITDTVDTFNPSENSNLNGPCLNMADLQKPMIALKINSATEDQFAGAVLQSSINGGLTWNVIGAIGDGVNWYDEFGVQGSPGGQQVGQLAWSGVYNEWRIAKISLNSLAGQPSVRLRIAFGSGPDTLNLKDGFALDSVWIGERDKLLLIENFTNTANTAAISSNDAALNSLVDSRNNDVVAIHYHTSFPGADVMNIRNPADPSSRVLHYGVPSVPYKVFDGNYDYGVDGLTAADIDRRSLESARFKISMSAGHIEANAINVKAHVIAADSIKNDIVVHVAVVERWANPSTGGTWQWVLAKMLPDAAGTYFSQDFQKGDSIYVEQTWYYTAADVYSSAQLGVVVFVQDALTKEVYQAAYVGPDGPDNGALVPISKKADPSLQNIFLYPNPAAATAYVVFGEAAKEDLEYVIYDEIGKISGSGQVKRGDEGIVIDTKDLSSGIYVVKIGNNNLGSSYMKFVVSH